MTSWCLFFYYLLVFHPSLHMSGRKVISKLWCTVWDVYLVWCCQYYKRNGKLCSKIKSIPLLNNMEGKYRHKSTCLAFILFFILQYMYNYTRVSCTLLCSHSFLEQTICFMFSLNSWWVFLILINCNSFHCIIDSEYL